MLRWPKLIFKRENDGILFTSNNFDLSSYFFPIFFFHTTIRLINETMFFFSRGWKVILFEIQELTFYINSSNLFTKIMKKEIFYLLFRFSFSRILDFFIFLLYSRCLIILLLFVLCYMYSCVFFLNSFKVSFFCVK